jgi:hypothetical protein
MYIHTYHMQPDLHLFSTGTVGLESLGLKPRGYGLPTSTVNQPLQTKCTYVKLKRVRFVQKFETWKYCY